MQFFSFFILRRLRDFMPKRARLSLKSLINFTLANNTVALAALLLAVGFAFAVPREAVAQKKKNASGGAARAEQTTLPTKTLSVKPTPSENLSVLRVETLLWKIEGKGLKAPSYLFGTIHRICQSDLVLTAKVKSAFRSTAQLAMEIDIDEALENSGDLLSFLGKGAMMKGDTTLAMLMDSSDYALLERFFTETVGMPLIEPFNRFKPMLLSMAFMEAEQDCEETSYEEEFAELARRYKKMVAGIETVEEQMSFFDEISYKEQAEMIVAELRAMDEPAAARGKEATAENADLKRVVKLYQEGKVSELLELLHDEMSGEFERVLLQKRNKAWIPKIESMMRARPTFIAVGAGHLPGEQGLVHLLRQSGYKLTAIPSGK
jgi:uncharacterized protein YbaP (TraB family)